MSERDPYARVEYRRLIAWPDRIRREWSLIDEVLGSGPSRRIVELGSGPAQHARALVDGGYEVVALDRSESMIESASEEPIPPELELVLGDMVEVDRLTSGTFGGALCLGNTLPHLGDEERLRRFAVALAKVLEPGAPLLLQILNYDRIHDRGIRSLPLSFRPHEEGELVFLRLMEPLPDGRVRFYPSTLLLRPGREPALTLERSREILLRGWRHPEVEEIFREAGLRPERALGGFEDEPFDPSESHDLVLVARREG